MSFTVFAYDGDSLCTIAQRHGFSDCRPLRALPANNQFLDSVLQQGYIITIPDMDEASLEVILATGRRYVFCCGLPQVAPAPTEVRFVRTSAAVPSNGDAIANIGISRYITCSISGDGDDNWVDHTHRVYDINAFNDLETFNVDVIEPNGGPNTLVVHLEALMPLYNPAGVLQGHQRFPVGAIRNSRSLSVTLSRVGQTNRFRSSYLRLVVDPFDQQMRPLQTLLVTDMVANGQPEVEILDQNILARYEQADCPLPAGERCLLARRELPLRRGRSVSVEARVLRTNHNGQIGQNVGGLHDDGVVLRADVKNRILQNARRIWAQEEIAFVINRLETVDPPSDMLTISDPDGANAQGNIAGGMVPGVIGFDLTVTVFGGGLPQVHQIGPLAVNNGQTPLQTAQAIAQAINNLNIVNLVATASQNRAIDIHAAGSADVVLALPGGRVQVGNLTLDAAQDAAQKVQAVSVDIANFEIRAGASNAFVGSAMQRCLYKSYQIDHAAINLFVVTRLGPGNAPPLAHTLNSQQHLAAQFRPLQTVENCICLSAEVMDGNLNSKPATLPHEMGHILIDNAEHASDNDAEGSLMNAATSQSFGMGSDTYPYDTKRISAHNHRWLMIVRVAGYPHPGNFISPPNGRPLWIAFEQNHSMHGMVQANNRLNFQNR